MAGCPTYQSQNRPMPMRLLLTADRKLGIIILYISKEGARTSLIEISEIEAYARDENLKPDIVFDLLMVALYFIAEATSSESFNSGDEAEKVALAAKAALEVEKFKSEGGGCNTDFSFMVEPKDDTAFSMTRFSMPVDIIAELIKATDAGGASKVCKAENTAGVFIGKPTGDAP